MNPAAMGVRYPSSPNTQVQERGVFAMQVALGVVCWPFSFQRSCCPQAVCVLPLGAAHVLAAVLMLLPGPDAPLIILQLSFLLSLTKESEQNGSGCETQGLTNSLASTTGFYTAGLYLWLI